jgi:hypothetical protein
MPDVIADDWLADTQVSYDTVAASYAVQARAALAAEPYLRAALVLLADMVHAIPAVFGHFRRVLRPGGPLLLGFHAGDGSRLKTEGYGGHPMKVYVHRRQPDQVAAWLRDAGFTIEAQMLLGPDNSVPGALLFARRPARSAADEVNV